MTTPRIQPLLAPIALALASCGSSTEPPPDPSASGTTPAKAEPAVEAGKAPAVAPSEAKAPPASTETKTAPTPTPTQTTASPASAATLRAVAVREGDVRLLRQGDAPLLVIDGEPLTLAGDAFTRDAVGSAGLWPDQPTDADGSFVVAATSTAAHGAWSSTSHEFMRSDPIHEVYQREDGGWRRLAMGKGLLVAYYAAFVERDGALLALRSWTPDPAKMPDYEEGEDDSKAAAYSRKLEQARARAKQAWVSLDGPEPAALPEIPAGVTIGEDDPVTTTSDGTIVALASERVAGEDDEERKIVLTWRPGQATADRVEIAELERALMPTLVGSGEWALLGGALDVPEGTESYLSIGRGDAWERVPVSLPGRPKEAVTTVSGAAKLPDGEIWIALANRFEARDDERQPVWRKPVDGPWEPVPLPVVAADAFGPDPGWERDTGYEGVGWIESRRASRKSRPFEAQQAPALLWAADAVWIVVGADFEIGEVGRAAARSVVLTTRPGAAPPTVLPTPATLWLERQNHARRSLQPGDRRCKEFSLALGPAAKDAPAWVGMVAKLSLPESEGSARVRSIYVAAQGSGEVLVADAWADSPAQAAALRDAVTAALTAAGVAKPAVVADCRVPPLERMVEPPTYP